MSRLDVIGFLGLAVGATFLLADLRWFRQPSLTERLAVHHRRGRHLQRTRPGILSVESFRGVIAPLSTSIGAQLSRLVGVAEPLEDRLARAASTLDPIAFRVRQVGWMAAVFALTTVGCLALAAPVTLTLLAVVGGPLLAFSVIEHQLGRYIDRRRTVLVAELPTIAEQLGMLLTAGYSLGSAIRRIAERGSGVCSEDLQRVNARVRQGLSETEALREWAQRVDDPALDRLVAVLALDSEGADLGPLTAAEARAVRAQTQRDLVERIERRSEQVWIPVSVATLLPGVVFMAVPFIEALSLFSGPA